MQLTVIQMKQLENAFLLDSDCNRIKLTLATEAEHEEDEQRTKDLFLAWLLVDRAFRYKEALDEIVKDVAKREFNRLRKQDLE